MGRVGEWCGVQRMLLPGESPPHILGLCPRYLSCDEGRNHFVQVRKGVSTHG